MRSAYLWTVAFAAACCLAFTGCDDDEVDLCESFWNWCDQCKLDCSGQKDWLNEATCDDLNSDIDDDMKRDIVGCIDSGCVPKIEDCLDAFGIHREDYDPGRKENSPPALNAGL